MTTTQSFHFRAVSAIIFIMRAVSAFSFFGIALSIICLGVADQHLAIIFNLNIKTVADIAHICLGREILANIFFLAALYILGAEEMATIYLEEANFLFTSGLIMWSIALFKLIGAMYFN